MFVTDPASVNIAKVLATELKVRKHEVKVYCNDIAFDLVRDDSSIVYSLIDHNNIENQLVELLKSEAVKCVVTGTSIENELERKVWSVAKHLGIRCISYIDQWMNIEGRFNRCDYLPDQVIAIDDTVQTTLISLGFRNDQIYYGGQPYFEYTQKTYSHIQKKSSEKKRILFLSQPISLFYGDKLGYTENEVIKLVSEVIKIIKREMVIEIELAIRLHPKEDQNKYLSIMERGSKIELDSYRKMIDSIVNSDLVIGMFSSGLIEASLLNKSVLSIQPGLLHPEADLNILNKIDNRFSIYDEGSIAGAIMQQLIQQLFIDFDVFKGSLDKYVRIIEEDL